MAQLESTIADLSCRLRQQPNRTVQAAVAICVICGLGLAWIAGGVFARPVSYPDAGAYRFQAELFASGRLSAPCIEDRRVLPSPHLCIHDGRVMAKYPVGQPLFLAPGMWLGAWWLMPVAGSLLTVWLVFLLARDMFGERLAIWTAGLVAVSPAMIVLGVTPMSETSSRLMLAAYLLGLVRWLRGGHWGYALLTGAALGYAFNCRPLTAVAFALPGAVFWAWSVSRDRTGNLRAILAGLPPAILAFAIFFAVYLGWNAYHTGSPWQSSFNDQFPGDRIGFGVRWEGVTDHPASQYRHSISDAVRRTLWSVLPMIAHQSAGLGSYHWDLASVWTVRTDAALSCVLYLGIWCLIALPVLRGSRSRYDVLLLGILGADIVAYSFHFIDQCAYGWTVFFGRYHNEATLLAAVPLLVRGLAALGPVWAVIEGGWLLRRTVLAAVVVGAGLNTVYTSVAALSHMERRTEESVALERVVRTAAISKAVVFLTDFEHEPPPGAYPLRSLEDAGTVYYRLSGDQNWLPGRPEPWWEVRRRLFPDRIAWEFQGGPRLQRLDQSDEGRKNNLD